MEVVVLMVEVVVVLPVVRMIEGASRPFVVMMVMLGEWWSCRC
jgi:hypothetical protein